MVVENPPQVWRTVDVFAAAADAPAAPALAPPLVRALLCGRPMRSLAALPLLAVLLPTLARAAPATPDAEVEEEATEVEWYRGKMLLADVASVGLIVAGGASGIDGLAQMGTVGLFVAAPAVHLSQGNGGRAVASVGLRLASPVVGALISLGIYNLDREDSGDGHHCDCMGGMIATIGGAFLGMATGMLIDDLALPRKLVPRKRLELSLAPSFSLGRDAGSVGLGGRF